MRYVLAVLLAAFVFAACSDSDDAMNVDYYQYAEPPLDAPGAGATNDIRERSVHNSNLSAVVYVRDPGGQGRYLQASFLDEASTQVETLVQWIFDGQWGVSIYAQNVTLTHLEGGFQID